VPGSPAGFQFDCFLLDCEQNLLLKNGTRIRLTAKPLTVLVYLIQNRDRTVSKDELLARCWPVAEVTSASAEQAIRQVRAALGDQLREPRYVQTVWGEGYRFVGRVERVGSSEGGDAAGESAAEEDTDRPVRLEVSDAVATSGWPRGQDLEDWSRTAGLYEMVVSSLYAALYSVALLTETAYQFERFRNALILLVPLVFAWSLTTALLALLWDRRAAQAGRTFGLGTTASFLLASAALQFAIVCTVLPDSPITKASFQTYTARAAFLKDSIYFVVLGIMLIVVPFDFVSRARCGLKARQHQSIYLLLVGDKKAIPPAGAVYWRLWVLALITLFAAGISLPASAHLLDNLVPDPNQGLFASLLQVQRILYFLTALLCIWWYYCALNDLRRECRMIVDEEHRDPQNL